MIQRFGKRHLEDVEPEVNTLEAVAPWCSIDTSSGNLTVVLEPFNCFDAEMYADELTLDEPIEFREDQRSKQHIKRIANPKTDGTLVNLGRWILRYLFAKLIDEEIKRDEAYRQKLNENVERRQSVGRIDPPPSISIPAPAGWQSADSPTTATTPRANGNGLLPTPGLGIAAATPSQHLPGAPGNFHTPSSPVSKRSTQLNRPSVEDYFSSDISSVDAPSKPVATPATTETTSTKEEPPQSPTETKAKEKDAAKSPSTPFAKKFRMGMSFGTKKTVRSTSSSLEKEKPVVAEEKSDENKSESSSNHEKEFDDNFHGVIQRIRSEYEKQLQESPDRMVETRVTPSLPIDTPVLKLPPGTRVIIQEETSGGSANLYRGTVETVGNDADIIEEKAPMWLGEVLLMVS